MKWKKHTLDTRMRLEKGLATQLKTMCLQMNSQKRCVCMHTNANTCKPWLDDPGKSGEHTKKVKSKKSFVVNIQRCTKCFKFKMN